MSELIKSFEPSSENNQVVSVVVATYRRDELLKNAILSIVNQTYDKIEIIVVDDNAEPFWNSKVEDIIKEVSSDSKFNIIYIKNEEPKGSAETRNVGIREASGDYISFLDDDDVYLPNKITNQIEHMLSTYCDYCITDLQLYNENDKLIDVRIRDYIKSFEKDDLFIYHLKYHMTGTDTMMFKKDYIDFIGGFPPINFGDEFYLMVEAILADGKFSYLPVCDIKAYIHTRIDGMSSGEGKIKGEKALYEYKKDFFDELDKQTIKYIKTRHYAVLAFADLRRRKYSGFIKNALYAFFLSPVMSMEILRKR